MTDETINVTAPRVPASTAQYLRSCSLTLGSSTATGINTLDLSQLRIVFSIVAASASTARQLNARVYNVSRATASKIEQEYTSVQLSAGYQKNLGRIFSGSIQQKRHGRESSTDTYLDIFASDGYDVLANATISQTLAAGWTYADVYREIISAGAPYGLLASKTLPPDTQNGIRPLVLFGALRDVMDNLAKNLGLRWSIDEGVLTFVLPSVADPQPANPALSLVASNTGLATVLSPSTGLIGIPAQTLDGIEATCLLNPRIKPGGFIKLDRSLITAGKNDLAVSAVNPYPSLAADGIYRVMWVEHEGDTRGQPWYTHIVSEASTGQGTIQAGAIEKAGFAGGL